MKKKGNTVPYLMLAAVSATGLLAMPGCQKDHKSAGFAENLSVKWTAQSTLKSLEKQSRSRVLLGVMKNVKKNYWPVAELNGYPCRIGVFSGKDSPWANGATSFRIYLRRPEASQANQEKDPIFDNPRFDSLRDERYPEVVKLHGSNSPNPHMMKKADGSFVIRFWTSSGLFILSRTGYSDLNFNRQGQLVGATFGDYTLSSERSREKEESVLGQCVLNEPFSFS